MFAGIANPVRAAGDPNQAKGIVVEHCAGCHAVPGYSKEGLISVDAPPFQGIADNPHIYTIERLRGFLVKPHWPMTRFRFSPTDIDNIIAFIASLRSQ